MAPIAYFTHIVRDLNYDDADDNVNGVRGITHTLQQVPFRHLSPWAYFALAVILLAVTLAMGYFLHGCYRSVVVEVEAVGSAHVRGDIYTESRTSRRTTGRNREKVQVKRRGIVAFSEEAKGLGCSKNASIQISQPSAPKVAKQDKRLKSSQLQVTYPDTPIRISGYSSDGDTYVYESPVSTPPPAYFQSSSIKRVFGIGFGTKSSIASVTTTPTTPTTPATPAATIPTAPITPTTSAVLPTRRTPLTPTAVRAIDPRDIRYDPHHIRYVLPREKSVEGLESAKLWSDPKLSPVGGNIIYPSPRPAPSVSSKGPGRRPGVVTKGKENMDSSLKGGPIKEDKKTRSKGSSGKMAGRTSSRR